MMDHTDIESAPWHVVHADVKRHARLNCISHLLDRVDHGDLTPDPIELPERGPRADDWPDIDEQNGVPAVYGSNPTDEG